MSKTSKALDELESRLAAQERIESITVTGLRPILLGAASFIEGMDTQIRLLDELNGELGVLETNGAAAGLLVKYESQKQELLTARHDLLTLKAAAGKVLELAKGADKSYYGPKQIEAIWDKHIRPLLREEQMRKYRAMRIQGTMVEEKCHDAEKCNGMIAEAIVEMVKYITHVTSDTHSELTSLWRWISHDGSIWLYHHSDHEKWKCMFFRIHVNRTYDNLSFSMESYVPFGFGNDPAHYEMETSEVYLRPGWRAAAVNSASYSTMNTFNLQSSITHTDGVSIGTSASVNFSNNEATSIGTSESVSYGTNESVTDSHSWFNNWSESMGSSYSDGGLGGNPSSGASHTQTFGGGSGGAHSNTYGTSVTNTTGTNENRTTGTTQGVGYTEQENRQQSIAKTAGIGIAKSAGETLQVKVLGYGIHLGKKSLEHLEKWKESNRDAARVYNGVHRLFDAMCKEVAERLRSLTTGTGVYDEGKLRERLAEIEPFFLVEPQSSTANPSDAIMGRSQHSAAEPIRRVTDAAKPSGRET